MHSHFVVHCSDYSPQIVMEAAEECDVSLLSLPPDVLELILTNVSLNDIISLRFTCQTLNVLVKEISEQMVQPVFFEPLWTSFCSV